MRSLALAPLALLLCLAPACSAPADDGADTNEARDTTTSCAALDAKAGSPVVFFSPFDRPEDQALCALSTATHEVVIAHYNIRRERVIRKLIELKNRGVDVKIAVDKANAANEWNVGDDELEAAGIPIVRTKPAGSGAIMHLKAVVIDGKIAMTGSFNWNETAALANDENMVVFRDAPVVSRYRNQILEVLGEKPREEEDPQATPSVRVYFSPEHPTDGVIAGEIDKAQTSVDVAMYTFTQSNIVSALDRAAKRGVRVRLVVEKKQADVSSADESVAHAGALVVRGENTVGQYSAMHQKYAVIDGHEVITGATNWTNSGTRSNEEDLVLVDSAPFAVAYRKNFADLLHVYGGLDVTSDDPTALANANAPVLFNPVFGGTQWGDRVVVVGSDPALGAWDPAKGISADTDQDLFPSWSAVARLPAGAHVEYKYVVVRADGRVDWEPGPNRAFDLTPTGRGEVESGNLGDTSQSWTPRTKP